MKNKSYEVTWEMKTNVENHVYEDVDFSNIDFNSPIFTNVSFKNCTFANCDLDNARTYTCKFYTCKFDRIDLRGVSVGAHHGLFEDCIFLRCDFRRLKCSQTDFIGCIFEKCKLKGWEPDASYFENCKIIGKLSEVTFYNYYSNDFIKPEKDSLFHSIDFSDAEFGEYVAFENCDLSRSLPPKGKTFEELLSATFSSRKIHGGFCISTPAKDN